MPEGAKPTATSRVEKLSASIALSVPDLDEPVMESVAIIDPLLGATVSDEAGRRPPRLVTKILLEEIATAKGAIPTGTSRFTRFDSASITARVLFRLNAT